MENLFFFVKSCSTWKNDGQLFLYTYFIEQGAFGKCLLIALCVAAVGAAVYYGFIGMKSESLSTLPVWLLTLVAVGLVSLAFAQMSVIGSPSKDNGVFRSMNNRLETIRQDSNNSDRMIEEAEYARNELSNKIDEKCDVVYAVDGGTTCYAILFFFIISIAVKRLTVHASAIPFAKP